MERRRALSLYVGYCKLCTNLRPCVCTGIEGAECIPPVHSFSWKFGCCQLWWDVRPFVWIGKEYSISVVKLRIAELLIAALPFAELPIAYCPLPIAKLPIAALPIAHCLLPHCLLPHCPSPNCPLPIAHCPLPIAHYIQYFKIFCIIISLFKVLDILIKYIPAGNSFKSMFNSLDGSLMVWNTCPLTSKIWIM